ncbi:MAG TPA: AraC family transcriptional regulator [Terracidiphilus sp.]|nr:AraC family transcriptional regulator [Terracidiphilus sp.]
MVPASILQFAKTESSSAQEVESPLLRAFADRILAHAQNEGDTLTAIPGFRLFRRTGLTSCTSAAYKPSLILYAQGQKTVQVGDSSYICDAGTCQLTSVDMPVFSQVTRASQEEPILAIVLKIDMAVVHEILSRQEFLAPGACTGTRGMAIGESTHELLTACLRLVSLLDTPQDIDFMAGLVEREIVNRAQRSPLGKHLRAIATLRHQSNQTAKVIAWLKSNYNKPLHVNELAEMTQMGVSTFHLRFKSLTQMSPLQYQKRLRPHQARLMMINAGLDAATAAYEVGYESASQFSREYRRFFGQPPMRDVKARQTA